MGKRKGRKLQNINIYSKQIKVPHCNWPDNHFKIAFHPKSELI